MFSGLVKLAKRQLGLAVLVLLGLSAAAQQTIEVSTPSDGAQPKQANTFMPDHSTRNPDSFKAPTPFFGNDAPSSSFDRLPGGPAASISAAAIAQWQKQQEQKKNWGLMTPEEILNVPTPEKVLGLGANDKDARLSPEEQYLKRQDRLAAAGASNALHAADLSLWHSGVDLNASPFQGLDAAGREKTSKGSLPGAATSLGSLFGQGDPSQASLPVKAGSTWASSFNTLPPLPKPTPDQLAGIERFNALLESSVSEKTPAVSTFSLPRAVAPDPFLDPLPAVNLAGRAVPAIKHDITGPKGITPLPGITGPVAQEKKAAPLVQPPPWMQDPLQNSSLPSRQY
jgi:hypothetical protein